jgi:uncharacterized protein Veg
MEDQKSLQIADAVITLLEDMQDGENDLYIKVNLGRIKKLTSHNGIIAEVYINDEDNFQYDFSKDEHRARKTQVMIGIFVKGIEDQPTRKVLNAKDLTVKVIENHPILTVIEGEGDESTTKRLTGDCRILRVENGRRAEGDLNKPSLFSASMIHVQYDVYN